MLFIAMLSSLLVAAQAQSSFLCDPFSVTNTNSAQQNYATCSVTACTGSITFTVCSNGGSYTGDTYFTLVNSAGTVLAANDDTCALGSQIVYNVNTCDTYTVRQGCFSSGSCSGTTAVVSTDSVKTGAPVFAPTAAPTGNAAPSTGKGCDPFSVTNTNSAQQNYATCSFYACEGTYTMGVCSPGTYTGDTYLRLVNSAGVQLTSNDDTCALGSQMTYTFTTCDTYTIREGCFSTGTCTGTVVLQDITTQS